MTETNNAASSTAIANTSKSQTASNTLEQADQNLLNALGEKIGNATGQPEKMQKATTLVQQKVLNTKENIQTRKEIDQEVEGFGAAKEHGDNAGDEQVEEFLRHLNRSHQG